MLRKQWKLTTAATVRACRGEVLEGGRRSGVAVLHEIPAEPRLWRARGAGETAGVRIARKHSRKRRLEDPSLDDFLQAISLLGDLGVPGKALCSVLNVIVRGSDG